MTWVQCTLNVHWTFFISQILSALKWAPAVHFPLSLLIALVSTLDCGRRPTLGCSAEVGKRSRSFHSAHAGRPTVPELQSNQTSHSKVRSCSPVLRHSFRNSCRSIKFRLFTKLWHEGGPSCQVTAWSSNFIDPFVSYKVSWSMLDSHALNKVDSESTTWLLALSVEHHLAFFIFQINQEPPTSLGLV